MISEILQSLQKLMTVVQSARFKWDTQDRLVLPSFIEPDRESNQFCGTDGEQIFQVHGSGELIQLLLKNDLVDELWLKIYPLTLGKGKKLFDKGTIPAAFTLTEILTILRKHDLVTEAVAESVRTFVRENQTHKKETTSGGGMGGTEESKKTNQVCVCVCVCVCVFERMRE